MAKSDWRWLCTFCWTEGVAPPPDACPTCGCRDAWFETNRHDGRPMREVFKSLARRLRAQAGRSDG